MNRIFLLAATLLTALTAQAQSIIYGHFDLVAEYPLAAQSSLDFNGDGVNELQINVTAYDLGLNWSLMDFNLSGSAQSLTPIYHGLSLGTAIGSDAGAWENLTGSTIYSSGYNGQNNTTTTTFALSTESPYLPISFDLADGMHYGWVRFETKGIFGFEDWAYESEPNKPIMAGEVPEPSTLLLSSVGILTIFLTRKRFGL